MRSVLFGVAALALGAMGPAAAADAPVTLTFANWAAAESATRPGIEQVIRAFEAEHPDIRIKSEAVSFTEIAHQLVLRARSGNPPDVAELAGNDTILLALTGKLAPLDSYVDPALAAALKPTATAGLRRDGKLIAFPWTSAPAALWYDKAVMAKAGLDPAHPPQTIDALMAALAAIKRTQPDVIPLGLDTTNRPFALISNWPWMRTFGADPLADGGRGAEAPAMKAYLAWMRDLAQKGYIESGRKIGEYRPLAAQDKVAFLWDQVLVQGVIQNANHMPDADFYQHWGVAVLPAGPAGKPYSFEGGHQLVMFAGSAHKQAAWTFIKYLATAPSAIQSYTVGAESSLMPLASAPTEALAKQLDTPVFRAFSDAIMPTVSALPYGPSFAGASTAVMAGVQQAVTGDTPVDGIAAAMGQAIARE